MLKTISVTLMCLLVAGIYGCDEGLTPSNKKPKYQEEPYTLNDGTPCVILHGGSHSGMIGITCNYNAGGE